MFGLMKTYFSPLDKESCIYFLFLSMLFFVILILTILSEMIYVFSNYKNLNFRSISNGVIILFNIFIAYFVNRLLYTMCSKSLA
jgi:hypothetical protein